MPADRMYTKFYGFTELPFNVTPDPRFLYLNDCYQEAIAALGYGIEARKGFVSLIGEAGTGKTTLLRRLLDTLEPTTRSVLLLHPTVSFEEILEHVLLELGISTEGRKLHLLQRLHEFLLEHTHAGGNVVLLIDEAQDLHATTLEELRLLSNLETGREKILQIVLAGQPELENRLDDPGLRQLRQRIALHIRLRPLSVGEMSAYIQSRLDTAGARDKHIFSPDAIERVAVRSGGIPRVANVLCDACLVAGFAAGQKRITAAIVEETWGDYERRERPSAAGAPISVVPSLPPLPPRHEEIVAPAAEPPAAPPPMPVAFTPADFPPPPARRGMPLALLALVLAALFATALSIWRHAHDDDVAPAALAPSASIADDPAPDPPVPVAMPEVAAPLEEPPPPSPVRAEATDPATKPADTAAIDPAPEPAPSPAPVASAPVPPEPLPPITASEATSVVEAFRAAYEARDVARVTALFASDAAENVRRGEAAIAGGYRETFARWSEIEYAIPRLQVSQHGTQVLVRAPFTVRYRETSGQRGQLSGWGEWQIARENGRPVIAGFSYRYGRRVAGRTRHGPQVTQESPPPQPAPAVDEDHGG